MTITEPVVGRLPDLAADSPAPRPAHRAARAQRPARSSRGTRPSPARRSPACTRSSCARARGCVIEDVDGNRFLDFNAGIAVAAAGHGHPAVNAAIHAQVDDVLHYCSSDFYLPAYADVCERLAAPGADARRPGVPEQLRHRGRRGGAQAGPPPHRPAQRHRLLRRLPRPLARQPVAHRQQGPPAGRLRRRHARARSTPRTADPYDPDALTGAAYIEQVLFTHRHRPADVAAIFVEPIQGEGGYIVPPAGLAGRPPRGCATTTASCSCVDEVQSGVGRTGTMWACEHDGVEPDIMCIGKGLASGLPLAGIIARAEVMDWEPGGHGSTFGGNPVACAAAVATLDLVERRAGRQRRRRRRPPARRAARRCRPTSRCIERRARSRPDDRHRPPRPRHRRGARARRASSAACSCSRAGERSLRLAPPLVVTRRAGRHGAGDPRRRPGVARRSPRDAALPTTGALVDQVAAILDAVGVGAPHAATSAPARRSPAGRSAPAGARRRRRRRGRRRHRGLRHVAHHAGAGPRQPRAPPRRAAARAQGRPRRAGVDRGRQDPLRRPRRGPGDDRHLRLRRRPVAPAARPDDRQRAARPPDDGDVAPDGAVRRDHGVQLPGRGVVVERRAGARRRRPGAVEAVGQDAAHRAGVRRPAAPGRRRRRRARRAQPGAARRRRRRRRAGRPRGRRRSCRPPARRAWAAPWRRSWRPASGG